jgi:hypothetical protein
VSGQIEKECIAREPTLERRLALVQRWRTISWYSRDSRQIEKIEVDDLAKAATRNSPMRPDVFFHVLEDTSVKTVLLEPRLINIIKGEDWRAPIMADIHHYYKPDSTTEKIRMQQWAMAYQIVDNNLYKASISGPLLRCLRKAKGQEILSEVHIGFCGGHIGARALAAKVIQQGFY